MKVVVDTAKLDYFMLAIITYTQNNNNFCRTIFLLFLFSFSCSPDQEQQAKSSVSPGEEKNTIQPLVNALGDTVLTGVEIPVAGKKRSINEVMNVRVVPVGKPVITPANPNVFKAEQLKTVLPIESVDIKTYTVGSIPDPQPLINSIGVTIPTGVPIPAMGKRVPVKWPEPIPALAPRYKDNATIDIKFLGVEQGLPSNSVHSILQDSRGHFWFGTNGGGATLYDGATFRHFKEANGLTENSVYKIFEDRKGRIWFGTKKGLMYLDGAEFVQF
ncbi:MAG: hypothetical protein KAQ62_15250, partial [Cyclobacteriaceae bacterium]|nr:hypothetical protein [Cyclobacteriaceae bacterium]